MRTKHTQPTRTEMMVLKAIDDFWRSNAMPPTVRQIQAAAKISTLSMVNYHLNTLERLGKIEKRHGKPVPIWVIRLLAKSP